VNSKVDVDEDDDDVNSIYYSFICLFNSLKTGYKNSTSTRRKQTYKIKIRARLGPKQL
jgi:hypothetical protein